MADRNFSSNSLSLERKRVTLNAIVNVGATGAPTLQAVSGPPNARTLVAAGSNGFNGIKSISRTSAGLYVLTLQDRYVRLLAMWVGFQADAAPAAPNVAPKATGTAVSQAGGGQITFTCRNNAGAATDPASGEVMFIEIELDDSTAV